MPLTETITECHRQENVADALRTLNAQIRAKRAELAKLERQRETILNESVRRFRQDETPEALDRLLTNVLSSGRTVGGVPASVTLRDCEDMGDRLERR